ncbi:hypothetical protein PSY52_22990, partial [Shigella flexneri]|nr:hypothetical protein [Shigella flexneri]
MKNKNNSKNKTKFDFSNNAHLHITLKSDEIACHFFMTMRTYTPLQNWVVFVAIVVYLLFKGSIFRSTTF